jgi:hypothetical protein
VGEIHLYGGAYKLGFVTGTELERYEPDCSRLYVSTGEVSSEQGIVQLDGYVDLVSSGG